MSRWKRINRGMRHQVQALGQVFDREVLGLRLGFGFSIGVFLAVGFIRTMGLVKHFIFG